MVSEITTKDPRVEGQRWLCLPISITIAILAVAMGSALVGKMWGVWEISKQEFGTFSRTARGIPSPDTFRRMFEKIN